MSSYPIMSSSPHLHSNETVRGIMLDVIIALLPAACFSVYFFGMAAISIILTSVCSCVLFEWLFCKIMKKPNATGDLSAVVTGLLLAYNLPPTLPLWMVIIGAFFAIVIVKQFFGGIGKNFVNPALAARAFLLAAWTGEMTKWSLPLIFGTDAVSGATPMALLKEGAFAKLPSLIDVAFGNIGGCIGETSTLLLLIGGLYLVMRRVISFKTPLSFLGTVAIFSFLFGGGTDLVSCTSIMLYHLFGGGLILGAFFMATDYTTSPITGKGQIIMGIGCGLITILIRLKGGYPEGVSYAILFMNIVTPLIDRYTVPKPFGYAKKAKEAAKHE